jgi:catechol 2,3-dioxygenase-like lactoylglutathione lyase family enzyme
MTSRPSAPRPTAMLDHIAIATHQPNEGSELLESLLGGVGAYSGKPPGFAWRQYVFAAGPKVEVLTPTDPDHGAFLERFLARQGAAPHHYNFSVDDIHHTLEEFASRGLTPVQVHLDDPFWKEAFLRPSDGHGIVIQVAQHTPPSGERRPPESSQQPARTRLTCIEHHVADLDRAVDLFTGPLGGRVDDERSRPGAVAELVWGEASRIRLVARTGSAEQVAGHPAGEIDHLEFTCPTTVPGVEDAASLAAVSKRLGVHLKLSQPH